MKVRDLDAVDEACAELGLELHRGKRSFKWYGRFMGDSSGYGNRDPKTFGQCDHAISVKGDSEAYEVGLVPDGEGAYDLLLDTWGPGARMLAKAGQNLNRLRQGYSVALAGKRARTKLQARGFTLKREQGPRPGVVRLALVRR